MLGVAQNEPWLQVRRGLGVRVEWESVGPVGVRLQICVTCEEMSASGSALPTVPVAPARPACASESVEQVVSVTTVRCRGCGAGAECTIPGLFKLVHLCSQAASTASASGSGREEAEALVVELDDLRLRDPLAARALMVESERVIRLESGEHQTLSHRDGHTLGWRRTSTSTVLFPASLVPDACSRPSVPVDSEAPASGVPASEAGEPPYMRRVRQRAQEKQRRLGRPEPLAAPGPAVRRGANLNPTTRIPIMMTGGVVTVSEPLPCHSRFSNRNWSPTRTC